MSLEWYRKVKSGLQVKFIIIMLKGKAIIIRKKIPDTKLVLNHIGGKLWEGSCVDKKDVPDFSTYPFAFFKFIQKNIFKLCISATAAE